MLKTNTTQFKKHFDDYLQRVYQEPIIIDNSGKPSAVLSTRGQKKCPCF